MKSKIKDAWKYSGLTFELMGENDMFEMRGSELYAKGPLDRETKQFYQITVCCKYNKYLLLDYLTIKIILLYIVTIYTA